MKKQKNIIRNIRAKILKKTFDAQSSHIGSCFSGLQIIDDITDIHVSVSDDVVEKSEDTLTFLRNYIDQIETDLDKNKLKKYAQSIYNEVSE